MMSIIKKLLKDESGQAMSEYGLVLGIVAVAVIAALTGLREQITGLFTSITSEIKSQSDSISGTTAP